MTVEADALARAARAIEETSRPDDMVSVYLSGAGHDQPELIAVRIDIYGETDDGHFDVLDSRVVPYPIYVWDGYDSLLDMAADGRDQNEIEIEVWRLVVGPWLRRHGVNATDTVGAEFPRRRWT